MFSGDSALNSNVSSLVQCSTDFVLDNHGHCISCIHAVFKFDEFWPIGPAHGCSPDYNVVFNPFIRGLILMVVILGGVAAVAYILASISFLCPPRRDSRLVIDIETLKLGRELSEHGAQGQVFHAYAKNCEGTWSRVIAKSWHTDTEARRMRLRATIKALRRIEFVCLEQLRMEQLTNFAPQKFLGLYTVDLWPMYLVRPLGLTFGTTGDNDERALLVYEDLMVRDAFCGPGVEVLAEGALLLRDSSVFLQIALSLVRGLMAMHQAGVVHRDLKVDNLMFVRVQGIIVAKLIDFGLAVDLTNPDAATEIGLGEGTPFYRSPETLRESTVRSIEDGAELETEELDLFRADIYALGITLASLALELTPYAHLMNSDAAKASPDPGSYVTQRIAREPDLPMFEIDNLLHDRFSDVPGMSRVSAIIEDCCRYNPRQRPTISEVETALSQVAANVGVYVPQDPFLLRNSLVRPHKSSSLYDEISWPNSHPSPPQIIPSTPCSCARATFCITSTLTCSKRSYRHHTKTKPNPPAILPGGGTSSIN